MQLAEQDNLPTFPLDGWLERDQRRIPVQLSQQPGTPDPATEDKSNRGSRDIPNQDDKEPPPQTEKETTADTQETAWQQQHIATCVEERIPDGAPKTQVHDVLLHHPNPVGDREAAAANQKE